MLALGRPAEADELERGKHFLAAVMDEMRGGNVPAEKMERGAWGAMARVLFRLNEFVYLD